MSIKELSEDEILRHLKGNTILRNQQLSMFVKLLNSLNESSTLAIDGAWGSGKTVFVKQLCMLADKNVEDYGHNSLDEKEILSLREKQKVFYFNAWENDYIDDALGALLLKLIAQNDESLNAASIKRGLSMINPGAAIKKVTFDLYDPDGAPRKDKLIRDLKPIVNRHDAVNDFIDAIKGENSRLVFIIDELDRCKPSFAIDLLEVVKHYFIRNDVTFVVATNINELSHTIKKYYGEQFSAYGYLNKFFDFTFGLQKVETINYARGVLNWSPDNYVAQEVAHDAIEYYGFEMREVNAYHSALKLIDNFITKNGSWHKEQHFVQLLFVPLALALRIKNNQDYLDFTQGRGQEVLKDFLGHSEDGLALADKTIKIQSELSESERKEIAIDSILSYYNGLFAKRGYRDVEEDLQNFREAVSLIGSYTTIPKDTST